MSKRSSKRSDELYEAFRAASALSLDNNTSERIEAITKFCTLLGNMYLQQAQLELVQSEAAARQLMMGSNVPNDLSFNLGFDGEDDGPKGN